MANVIASPRISRLLERMSDAGLAGLLVTNPVNLRYLLGQPDASGGAYLICPDRRVAVINRSGSLREPSTFDVDPREPADLLSALRALDYYAGTVGYDDMHLSVGDLAALRDVVGDRVTFCPAPGVVEALREVKDSAELLRIAEAARLTDAVFEHLAELPWAGKTEAEMANTAETTMLALGADGPAFPTIVAAPPRSALVHAEPTANVMSPGLLVLVEVGARLDGYASDCARMFAIGSPAPELLEIYSVVREAQRIASKRIGPGVEASAVDLVAREALGAAGLGDFFRHGLGHGVGIEIDEAPCLSQHLPGNTLAHGNVVTVESGVYVPACYGVRIVDLVAVTTDGRSVLSSFPRDAPIAVA
jgi:Xaa-Pro aminopeptidase